MILFWVSVIVTFSYAVITHFSVFVLFVFHVLVNSWSQWRLIVCLFYSPPKRLSITDSAPWFYANLNQFNQSKDGKLSSCSMKRGGVILENLWEKHPKSLHMGRKWNRKVRICHRNRHKRSNVVHALSNSHCKTCAMLYVYSTHTEKCNILQLIRLDKKF
jgi:hypothetical protein